MARYASRAYYVPEDPGLGLAPDLVVDGPKEVHTGLVDALGHPIVRLQDPIGFHAPSAAIRRMANILGARWEPKE